MCGTTFHFSHYYNYYIIYYYIYYIGNATRECFTNKTWGSPDVSKCQSKVFINLKARVRKLEIRQFRWLLLSVNTIFFNIIHVVSGVSLYYIKHCVLNSSLRLTQL